MKINKNIIKELTEYLNEFNLTEIEYTEKDIKVKVSKSSRANIAAVKETKSENIKLDNIVDILSICFDRLSILKDKMNSDNCINFKISR